MHNPPALFPPLPRKLTRYVTPDFRRYLRPFFLDPATQHPLPSKRYYDVFSYLATQLTFSFAVAPFLILSLSGSLRAWSRVYFYAIIGTALSMALFASPPAKHLLKTRLEERAVRAGVPPTRDAQRRGEQGEKASLYQHGNTSANNSTDRLPLLGISGDIQQEVEDGIREIRGEIEEKRRLARVEALRVRERAGEKKVS